MKPRASNAELRGVEPWLSLLEAWAAVDDVAFIVALRSAPLDELRRVKDKSTFDTPLWRRIAVHRAIERAELLRTQCVGG